MSSWLSHLPVLPIALPMVTGAIMLLLRENQRTAKSCLAGVSLLLQLLAAGALVAMTLGQWPTLWPDGIAVYLLGDWPAPFGIVLVADRLSALLVLTAVLLGLCTWCYALARWDRAGVHFHPLFQFLLMGVSGAFLTGDLFNLFVFFEVMLTASYGLMLHGSGTQRVQTGLHYIVVNLVSSALLLIALAMIYGVTGTLNMAHLAVRAGELAAGHRALFEASMAILGIAFLIKAAAWPLNFWLPPAYANACAPVAGMFSILSKVGIYTLLRVGSLLAPTGAPGPFGSDWLFLIGLLTLAFGSFGLLAVQQVERQAGYAVILSSGTLMVCLGLPGGGLVAPALYYLISSVLVIGAFFLVLEMVSRTQPFGADMLAISLEAFDLDDPVSPDSSDDVVGVAIPAAMAVLGMYFFTCAILIAGLPPLSGFIAKFALLSAAFGLGETGNPGGSAWVLGSAILGSGLICIVALSRSGIRLFWAPDNLVTPRLRVAEAAPAGLLLLACVALTVLADPVFDYLTVTAHGLEQPDGYIRAVLGQASANKPIGEVTP